jgi:hypothetical protein
MTSIVQVVVLQEYNIHVVGLSDQPLNLVSVRDGFLRELDEALSQFVGDSLKVDQGDPIGCQVKLSVL